MEITEYPVTSYWNTKQYGSKYRSLKLALIKKFGVCYWCNIEVKDYPHIDGVPDPSDMATIDHVDSRYFRKKGEQSPKVLACYGCNQKRSRIECRRFGPRCG